MVIHYVTLFCIRITLVLLVVRGRWLATWAFSRHEKLELFTNMSCI